MRREGGNGGVVCIINVPVFDEGWSGGKPRILLHSHKSQNGRCENDQQATVTLSHSVFLLRNDFRLNRRLVGAHYPCVFRITLAYGVVPPEAQRGPPTTAGTVPARQEHQFAAPRKHNVHNLVPRTRPPKSIRKTPSPPCAK